MFLREKFVNDQQNIIPVAGKNICHFEIRFPMRLFKGTLMQI